MPSILKRFSNPKVVPFELPDAKEMVVERPKAGQAQSLDVEEFDLMEDADSEFSEPAAEPEESAEVWEEPRASADEPVSYARVQADMILQDARRQKEEIIAQAKEKAREEAEAIYEAAKNEGYQFGYAQGTAQAMEDGLRAREEQAARMEEQVEQFLAKAGKALDRQLDSSVDEMRDLAVAIAEKIMSISLKSSTDVITRMIQTALDKRKKREWIHIYIAECDAKRMAQIPASLSATLSAMSDRVRIIPMSGEEAGTCIIETPDEIIDASAATQLGNIKNILMDTPVNGMMGGIF